MSIVHSGVNYSGKTVECNYSYEYDTSGNITRVYYGKRSNTYVYDANNQLIRENNDRRQYTQTWEYDEFGNIIRTRKYAYTTGEQLGEPTETIEYKYEDNQGDVVALVDSTGTMIVGYYYSAYGYPILLTSEYDAYYDLKYLNPFLYRGYVYDIETKLCCTRTEAGEKNKGQNEKSA